VSIEGVGFLQKKYSQEAAGYEEENYNYVRQKVRIMVKDRFFVKESRVFLYWFSQIASDNWANNRSERFSTRLSQFWLR
jgi:hypothetical protein